MFGIVSTETDKDWKSLTSRRKIFYQYPAGALPIMGLLSLLPSEETSNAEFGWFERRFPTLRTTTVASGTAPFQAGDGTSLSDPVTLTMDTEYRVKVASTQQFKPTHVIEIRDVVYTGGALKTIKGTVTEINSTTQMTFRPYETTAGVENGTTDNNSKSVAIIGTANQEGARSGQGIIQYPVNPMNYTQIFRTAFSITRTALKQSLEFDKSGPYKQMAWDNGLRHMIEMEKAVIFGQRHTVLVTDPDTGEQTPERKMGGILWFLQQWEAADSLYRGGTGAPAITSNADPLKRIINVNGPLTKANYNDYISRAFVATNNRAYEKLCICGGTFLSAVNTIFENQVTKQVMLMNKERQAEFMVFSHATLRGTVYFKVHPLFDEDPYLQGSALIIDMGNLKWRPLTDSDTTFLKGRQETDRDARKDEWITEGSIEYRFPESGMYIQGVTGAA